MSGLTDDKDIWRAADLLIKQHGEDVEFFAAGRIDDMIERGDPVGGVGMETHPRRYPRVTAAPRRRSELTAGDLYPWCEKPLDLYYLRAGSHCGGRSFIFDARAGRAAISCSASVLTRRTIELRLGAGPICP